MTTLLADHPADFNRPGGSDGGAGSPPPPRRSGRRDRLLRTVTSEGGIVVLLAVSMYLTVGVLLDFVYHASFNDAVARTANGYYVLYSRDPHLAAIGFVWNPLQSIADMVPLLLNGLWPALAAKNMAGTLVSVVSMAGMVHQARAALFEWGVARAPRLVLTALLAVNPMVLLFSGSGMSEALYLFTLVATARYLSRWVQNGDIRSLIYAAVALGLCYLARNEAIAPAALGGAIVMAVGFARAGGDRRARLKTGLTDMVVFVLPCATAFVGWAIASLVIVGQPFAQFTSAYGTKSQLALGATGFGPVTLGGKIHIEGQILEYYAPFLALIAGAAIVVALRRRDPRILPIVAIVGSALGFDLLEWLIGGISYAFRYFIATVPLEMLLVGLILSPSTRPLESRQEGRRAMLTVGRWTRSGVVGALVAIAALGSAVPTTLRAMSNRVIDGPDKVYVDLLLRRPLTSYDRTMAHHLTAVHRIVDYVDRMHLPEGDVVVDNFSTCIPETILNSPRPKVFVIPNDRDYQRILADPLTFHTHYILIPQPIGLDRLTSTFRTYPTLYSTGAGFAKAVHQFPRSDPGQVAGDVCPAMRLYRVVTHPSEAGTNGAQ